MARKYARGISISGFFWPVFVLPIVLLAWLYFRLQQGPVQTDFITKQLSELLQKQMGDAYNFQSEPLILFQEKDFYSARVDAFNLSNIRQGWRVDFKKIGSNFNASDLISFKLAPKQIVIEDALISFPAPKAEDDPVHTSSITEQPENATNASFLSAWFSKLFLLPEIKIQNVNFQSNSQLSSVKQIAQCAALTMQFSFESSVARLEGTNPNQLENATTKASANKNALASLHSQFGAITSELNETEDMQSLRLLFKNIELAKFVALFNDCYDLKIDMQEHFTAVPALIHEAALVLHFDKNKGKLSNAAFQINVGETKFQINAFIDASSDQVLKGRLTGQGQIAPLNTSEVPKLVPQISGDILYDLTSNRLDLSHIQLIYRDRGVQQSVMKKPYEAQLLADLAYDFSANKGKIKLAAPQIDAIAAMHLWPAFIAHKPHAWLLPRLDGGKISDFQLQLALSEAFYMTIGNDKPLPPQSLEVSFLGEELQIRPLLTYPSVEHARAKVSVSSNRLDMQILDAFVQASAKATAQKISGTFSIPEFAERPAKSNMHLEYNMPIGAIVELLETERLRQFVKLNEGLSNIEGNAQGVLELSMPLKKDLHEREVKFNTQAKLQRVTYSNLIGDADLEQGSFDFKYGDAGLSLNGEARFLGQPIRISSQPSQGKSSLLKADIQVDLNAQTNKQLNLPQGISGQVPVQFTSYIQDGKIGNFRVEAQLKKLHIASGFYIPAKAANTKRIMTFTGRLENDKLIADDLLIEYDSFVAKGSAEFNKNGSFEQGNFNQLKFSRGDILKAQIARDDRAYKINITGNAFDMRPFVRSLQMGHIDNSAGIDFDLNVKTTLMSGFSDEVIAEPILKVDRRNGALRKLNFSGKLLRGDVSANLNKGEGREPILNLNTADAGATLRFFDIYSRMIGGSLDLQMQLGAKQQQGTLSIKRFLLRDEVGLKRIVAGMPAGSDPEITASIGAQNSSHQQAKLAGVEDVGFTKMTVNFARNAAMLDVREAIIFGPAVGGKLNGSLDYAHNNIDMHGSLVPAYALNNLFAKLPVLGPILGGDKHEGLFVLRFSVRGNPAHPKLILNPLSAVAPGFLRNFVDFRVKAPAQLPNIEE